MTGGERFGDLWRDSDIYSGSELSNHKIHNKYITPRIIDKYRISHAVSPSTSPPSASLMIVRGLLSRLSCNVCSCKSAPDNVFRNTNPIVIKNTTLNAWTYVSTITPRISIGTISGSYIDAADSRTLCII